MAYHGIGSSTLWRDDDDVLILLRYQGSIAGGSCPRVMVSVFAPEGDGIALTDFATGVADDRFDHTDGDAIPSHTTLRHTGDLDIIGLIVAVVGGHDFEDRPFGDRLLARAVEVLVPRVAYIALEVGADGDMSAATFADDGVVADGELGLSEDADDTLGSIGAPDSVGGMFAVEVKQAVVDDKLDGIGLGISLRDILLGIDSAAVEVTASDAPMSRPIVILL